MFGFACGGCLKTGSFCCQPVYLLNIGIEGDNKATRLFINGKLVEELNIQQRFFDKEGKTKMNYVRTLVFPLEQAGEFKSKISNLKVYKK